jgi:ABC-2 type transport system permease protein
MNWEQLQAIVWLRWRLTKNGFGRNGPVNAAIAFLLLGLVLTGAMILGVGGVLAGTFALRNAAPQILLVVWDGVLLAFLVVWVSGLTVEIQRAETIDLPKLLHLPVTLQQVFLFNYFASLFTPSIVLFLPGMMGLCAGLALSGGAAMLLLAPLTLSFMFMLTAWTYCLRGWLAALIINKRKRQLVVVWMTLAFVLVAQIPNILFNSRVFRNHGQTNGPQAVRQSPETSAGKPAAVVPEEIVEAHLAIPPGWPGYGAMALRQNDPWPALGAAAASCLLGMWGLMRAYRATIRFYRDAPAQTQGWILDRPAARTGPAVRRPMLVERRLPWLQEDTAALTLATFRSLLRAPEMKMGMILPVIAVVMLCSLSFTRSAHAPSPHLAAFAGTVAAVFSVFALVPVMSNVFGLDRNGFRALVLLPTKRHRILVAKNIAFFPFVGLIAAVFLVVMKVLVGMPWGGFFASLVQVPLTYLLFSLACNLIAMLMPFRLAAGTIQAKKPRPIVFLAVLATMLILPVLVIPALIPPGLQLLFSWRGWLPALPVNLLGSLTMLAAAAWLYSVVLPWEGRLLQRREQAILREVTEEVE